MNRDYYQIKLQAYYAKVERRFTQTSTSRLPKCPSEESLHQLQMLQIELNKKVRTEK